MLKPDIWQWELFSLQTSTQDELLNAISHLRACSDFIAIRPGCSLADLSYSVNCGANRTGNYKLSIVASSIEDLKNKLNDCAETIRGQLKNKIHDERSGVYYSEPHTVQSGALAFVYPGLGAAYVNMLRDLRDLFPDIDEVFQIVDSIALAAGATIAPSKMISGEEQDRNVDNGRDSRPAGDLQSAELAVVAVLMAEYALHRFLQRLKIDPSIVVGCSTGEFAAITTGGAIDVLSAAELFCKLSAKLSSTLSSVAVQQTSSLRVLASRQRIEELIRQASIDELYITADLGHRHVMLTGTFDSVKRIESILRAEQIAVIPMTNSGGYHTPFAAGMIDRNMDAIQRVAIKPFDIEAWSCANAGPFPLEPSEIRRHVTELFVRPILFKDTVERLYENGVRIFVEVGPSDSLTLLVKDILGDRPHLAVASDKSSRSSICQLLHLLAVLQVNNINVDLTYLYAHRDLQFIDLSVAVHGTSSSTGYHQCVSSAGVEGVSTDDVVSAFIATTNQIYGKVSEVERTVLSAYFSVPSLMPIAGELQSADCCELTVHEPDELKRVLGNNAVFVLATGNDSPTACALQQLSEEERIECAQLPAGSSRQRQWYLGRVAAKTAVQKWLSRNGISPPVLRSISIIAEQPGFPTVSLPAEFAHIKLNISISHKDGNAVALVCEDRFGQPGVDVEDLHLSVVDLESPFLSAQERELILASSGSRTQLYASANDARIYAPEHGLILKSWCAKEAAYKAYRGSIPGTQLRIEAVDADWNLIRMAAASGEAACTVLLRELDSLLIACTISTAGEGRSISTFTGNETQCGHLISSPVW